MTLLYADSVFLEHETGPHPESPQRLAHLLRHLEEAGLDQRCCRGRFEPISRHALQRVHHPSYIDKVHRFAEQGGGYIEVDTVVSCRSYEVALQAAGAVVAAVDGVMKGPDRQALCLVRPPGHHALPDRPMGFCLFNNIALAAAHALAEHALDRILIVDWDVHHGNGTQDIFYENPRVMFYSIHRYPFYPGTGAADETGAGPGRGYTFNVPVRFGTPRSEYLQRFRQALEQAAEKIRPELVLLSAGFDSHAADPIGSLGLEVEDFVPMTEWVCEVAQSHASGRLVSVLEGGYNVPILAQCVQAHLEVLLQQDM